MPNSDSFAPKHIPSWIFEQDFLVFLSFFGWMLLGLLALSQPFSKNEGGRLPWLWIGFYGFSQAFSDFVRTLSFSDSFFRSFNLEVGFEMLGYGLLVEVALRYGPRSRRSNLFPFAAVGGLFLGLSIEIAEMLYTLVVSFFVSAFAVLWAGRCLFRAAREEGRRELYVVVAGLLLILPTWILAPSRLGEIALFELEAYEDFPYYGFGLLTLRIAAGWLILGGLWYYRLQRRIEDVVPQVGAQLKLWGYRVLPVALGVVVSGSYLITNWNGQRMEDRILADYLSRAQTAAAAMDVGDMASFEQGVLRGTARGDAVASQLLAIREVDTDARAAYLWDTDAEEIRTVEREGERQARPFLLDAGLDWQDLFETEGLGPFSMGPLAVGSSTLINVNAPVTDRLSGDIAYWLGIDFSGASFFRNVSLARLQTVIIAGLIMALVIFFLSYQISHESEADLVLAKERAEAADRAKSEFLAVISHEIRTPLQSVLGYSDLLRSTHLDERQLACLETIQSEGKILLRIVHDILDFSNLRKESFQLEYGPVKLRRLIEETFRTIKPMAVQKGLQANLDIAEGVPAIVETDAVRLRQVLLNLFGNSVKYTESGAVFLNARYEEESEFPVVFEILDTGVGIKGEDLDRLFEPFVQLEHSTKFPREGAGLGLAIVNRIVEHMGGQIEVGSKLGKGSCFTAAFSFRELHPDESFDQERIPAESGEESVALGLRYPAKVLVVDDNPMVRRLIVQFLNIIGYEVDELDGGHAAAEQGPDYDLVVMDLRMPEVDGPEAARRIRARGNDAQRPWIIAVSASLLEDEVLNARAAGVNDFLGKPFNAQELARKITSIPWIEERRLESLPPEIDVSAPDEAATEGAGPVEPDPEDVFSEAVQKDPVQSSSSVFAGIDSYPAEAVAAAVQEVYSKHEAMGDQLQVGDWSSLREDAHYLANTAMALGIDQLYLDSKEVENAAQEADESRVASGLQELRRNFEAWDSN